MGIQNTGPATRDNERRATDTTRSLGRLLSCTAMYPPGHPRLVEAVRRAIRHVHDGPLVLNVRSDKLGVGSQPVHLEDRESRRLHADLRGIGVWRLRFNETITPDELCRFAAGILRAKAEADSSAGFVSIDVQSFLPESVSVQLRGFGARVANEDMATARVMDALEGAVPADGTDALAQAVGLIVHRVVERFDADHDPAPAVAMKIRRRLDEVLDLCAAALRAGVEELLSSGGQLTGPHALVQAAADAVRTGDDLEDTGFVVEVLRQAAEEAASSAAIESALEEVFDVDFELTMEELRESVGELMRSARPIGRAAQSGELAETLSILLQLCLRRPSKEALAGIGAKLSLVQGSEWSIREVDILQNGVAKLLETHDVALVDSVLPPLLESLRAGGAEILPRVLVSLVRTAVEVEEPRLLWPHVVNELLLGLQREHDEFSSEQNIAELGRFVESFDPAHEHELLGRLTTLTAFRKQRIAKDVLALRVPVLFTVLAELLRSSDSRRLEDRLFRALRERPMAWVGGQALQSATKCSPKVRDLILELLATDGQFEASIRASRLATRIMVESVQGLPEHRRQEAWVMQTLRALSRLDPLDEDGLLRQVMKERKLFRRAWPKACRLAARDGHRPRGGGS